jgi:hypothetical protein
MKLQDIVAFDELQAVMEQEALYFTTHNDEENKAYVKLHGDPVADSYFDLISEHTHSGPHAAGMIRMLSYIDQVLRRKSVQ